MVDRLNLFLHIWRAMFISLVLVASLFLLSFLFSSISANSAQASRANSQTDTSLSRSPNVITSNMVRTSNSLGKSTSSAAASINRSLQTAASATARSGMRGIQIIGTGLGMSIRITGACLGLAIRGTISSVAFVGRIAGTGIGFVARAPGKVLGAVSGASVTNAVIRPSEHADVPIIDPDSPELEAALAALPPVKKEDTPAATPAPAAAGPVWPIRGDITTEFGVPHRPYQQTHTGIDISDHKRAGITAVKPFRPGTVTEAISSRGGLGNHVIIDHGNGVTSVYGHLNSISVQPGQAVTLDTILGFEGTTGVSTGTHLHFEIRVNGQAANPHQFIPGTPI